LYKRRKALVLSSDDGGSIGSMWGEGTTKEVQEDRALGMGKKVFETTFPSATFKKGESATRTKRRCAAPHGEGGVRGDSQAYNNRLEETRRKLLKRGPENHSQLSKTNRTSE